MNYNKPPLSIDDQLLKLQYRGLIVTDHEKAVSYLSNISYYRLRAYTYPFQDNDNPDYPFTAKVSFEEIISLYVFDRQFRLFVLDAIEKIEISFRTQIIHRWAMTYGSHWHLENKNFRDQAKFEKCRKRLLEEERRSNETFIKHYRAKYKFPAYPPVWMSLEVSSLGQLSMIFENLKKVREKRDITKYYGLNNIDILENWIHAFSNIRNICAHHSRLWNRRLTTHIKIPNHTHYEFISDTAIITYKIYSALCCMKYILNIISPKNTFTQRLIDLMNRCPLANSHEMGFPTGWENDPFWQSDSPCP